jgi:hypothetical protein
MKPPESKGWRWKFSLAALLLSVTFLAVMFAALRSSSPIWSSAISTAAVTILVFALLGALVTREQTRALFVGFAFLGWVYLLVIYGPWFGENVAPHMLSSQGLGFAYEKLFGPASSITGAQYGLTFADFDTDAVADIVLTNDGSQLYRGVGAGRFAMPTASPTRPEPADFNRIGHCGLALVLAVVGGVVARALYRKGGSEAQPS